MSGRTLLVASNRNPALYEQTQKKKELVQSTEPFQGRFLTLSLFSSVVTHPHVGSPAQDREKEKKIVINVPTFVQQKLSWVTWLPLSQSLSRKWSSRPCLGHMTSLEMGWGWDWRSILLTFYESQVEEHWFPKRNVG